MKKLRIVVAVVVVAGGVTGWLYATGRIGGTHAPDGVLTLYGNVDVREVELGFRVAGRLQTMNVEEGHAITAGAVLAALDTRPFEDQLRGTQAQVAVQQAMLDKLVAGSRPAEVARAKAAVDETRAAKGHADIELERTRKLVDARALPGADLDTASAISRQGDARLASAQESLRLIVQGSRSEDIAAARATLQVAQANLASAQTALDDSRLVAPSAGVVTSRVREAGAIVSPNDIVYVVALTGEVWVRAYVSEAALGKLRPGMEVFVRSDTEPSHPYRGHVGFVSPTAEFTPKSVETPELRTALVYRLRVIIDDPAPGLRQGMPVTMRAATNGA